MHKRRVYIILLAVVMFSVCCLRFFDKRQVTVREGYTEPLIPEAWNDVIINELNTVTPEVIVEDRRIDVVGAKPYITNGPDVMVPVEVLEDGMQMLAAITDRHILHLYQGNRKVQIDLDTDAVTINGDSAVEAGIAIRKNGTVYVSAKFVSQTFGYDYRLNMKDKQAVFAAKNPKAPVYPETFRLSEVGRQPAVYDQGSDGTCWAYAALSALESMLLPEDVMKFSREHMAGMNSFGLDEQFGGESGMALAYLLAWQGPITETYDMLSDEGVRETSLTASRHVQGAVMLENASVETIKEAVFLYGGAEVSMYLVMADKDNLLYVDHYYNEKTHAYYFDGEAEINHDVVVVGWDDHFPSSDFVKGDRLISDGAFLCMNSWGRSFADNGLFWVSYEDVCFGTAGMYFTNVEGANNYAKNYGADLCGMTANAGYGMETAYFANVYTADSDETLAAVGFYTLGADSEYEIYAVSDFKDESSFEKRVFLKKGKIEKSGFTTVVLDKAVPLYAGKDFAVIVKLTTPGTIYPVAVEKVTETVGNVDISDGRGYLSNNGAYFRSTEKQSECNVCLKAYTRLR